MSTVGFWQQIRQDNRDINRSTNRLGTIANPWYIFPQGNGPRGSFATFTSLAPNLRSRDVIILGGVLREQAVAPLDIYDVTIIGAANTPRQATSGGVPTGGGACWLAPSSGAAAATPLLELRAQGWSIEDIEFTPHTSSAAIRITRSATVDTIDASHTKITGCLFAANGGSGQIGIESNGGSRSVFVSKCRFEQMTGTAISSLSIAATVPQDWEIADNVFRQNTNDIKCSLSYGRILRNIFMTAGSGSTNKVVSTDTGGAVGNNAVLLNQFNNGNADIDPSHGFTGTATDIWMNYVTDQAALVFGQPA